MTHWLLYAFLVKATIASFSGFGSLPQIREDLVVRRTVVTDEQLNRAVLASRMTPGAMGLYVVAVGYEAGGFRGAVAGWLAVVTPALFVIPLARAADRIQSHRRVRGAIDGLILASAVMIAATALPLMWDVGEQWMLLIRGTPSP
jgi:chromate transporter